MVERSEEWEQSEFTLRRNDPIATLRQIDLYKRLDDLRTKAIFNMLEAISLNILIGTYFMNNYVTSIYPRERRLNALSWRPIAILSTVVSVKLVKAAVSSEKEQTPQQWLHAWKWIN